MNDSPQGLKSCANPAIIRSKRSTKLTAVDDIPALTHRTDELSSPPSICSSSRYGTSSHPSCTHRTLAADPRSNRPTIA